MKSASIHSIPASRRPLQGSNRHYVWWIAAVVVAAGVATLSWTSDHKYAPAEEGTITLSRSF